MFDDKFVVESPGIFAGTVTTQNIKTTHFSRNKAIAAYMKEYKFVKEFGEGVKRIYREMDEANLPNPTFKKQAFMTIATIRNNFFKDNVPNNVPRNVPRKSSDEQYLEAIISAINEKPNITRDELAIVIGKSTKTVQRIISSSGKIKHIGPLKGGHWEILSEERNKNDN